MDIDNAHLSLSFDLSSGVLLTGIRDKVTGHQYLCHHSMVFEFAVNNGTPRQSDTGLLVDGLARSGDTQRIDTHALSEPLAISIAITPSASVPVIVIRLVVTNTGSAPIFLRTVIPPRRRTRGWRPCGGGWTSWRTRRVP
jgi:hypothetical protein